MVVPAGCKDSNEDCFSIDLWKTASWYNGLHGQSTTSDAIQMCCQNRYSFIPGILSIMPATVMVIIHVWWLPTAEDWLNPAFIQEAFEARALRMAVNCAQNIGQAANQEEGSIYIIQHHIPFSLLNCTCSVLFGINCTSDDCAPCRFLWTVPRFAWVCGSSHPVDHCNQVSITSFQPCWWNMCHSFHHLFKNGWRFIATLLLNVVLGSSRRYIRTFLDMEWRNSSRTSAMFMPSTFFTSTWVISWQPGASHPSRERWQTSSWASSTHRYAGLCFFC